jgi:uncharacterized protein YkwD
MDLTALHKGVIQLAASAAAVFNISIAPAAPQNEGLLQSPEVIESQNLPLQNISASPDIAPAQSLNAVTEPETEGLKMVFKIPEVKAEEIITVEQPPVVFTVTAPTPKPAAESKDKSETINSDNKESAEKTEPKASEKPKSEELKKEEIKSPEPSSSPVSIAGGSNADILFQMTNDHRSKIGKPALEKDERLCKIAEGRAPQVNGELSSGNLHKGFKELNLPYWATENIAAYATMKENFNFLVTDYIHKKAIESDAKYSCTACSGTSCSQIFSSFVSK